MATGDGEEEGQREQEEQEEAVRLKALAESKFKNTNNPKQALKYAQKAQLLSPDLEGISETVTSLNILCAPDIYAVLDIDHFANTNTIRKQYKNLTSILQSNNNTIHHEALNLVQEAFRVLSDTTLRKEYDAKLQNDGPIVEKEEEETLGDFVLNKKSKEKVGDEKGGDLKGNDKVGVVGRLRKKMRTVGEVLESSKSQNVGTGEGEGEETMTLAEFQSKVKRKVQKEKMKEKEKEKEEDGRMDKRSRQKGLENRRDSVKRNGLRLERHRVSNGGESEQVMAVVDSDFYDFDKDRVERSFKKGQVWAVYDDDDGMPRNYALIDETVSTKPFEVRISWLDFQNNGDERIVSREKLGFHIPCGRFKVANKASISLVNIFSHVVDCDQAAREVYQIYPKKGSIWALFSEAITHDADEGKRRYDIVVFLTSYSEINGLSMAYLEKVDGYKTVFKRQEMGSHAIRFLGKDDIWLISHQIPARKLPSKEASELLKGCWELDPASLPSDLLTTGSIDN